MTNARHCLDAELAAAWFDGALPDRERAAIEAHAADCARCQALLAAMARTEPIAEPKRWWQSLPMRWLVPATAAAAALALWVAMPHERSMSSAVDTVARSAPSENKTPPATEERAPAPAPAPRAAVPVQPKVAARDDRLRKALPPEDKAKDAKPDATANRSTTETRESQPSAGARESVDVAGRAALSARFAGPTFEVASPDGQSRWRMLPSGAIEHSDDAGATWASQETGQPAGIVAGTSPARNVVWLVGRGGIVLLSGDGQSWERHTIGETVDLVSVRATDARTATVTTADGRQFTTNDAGSTWSPARLQENSPAPF